VNVNVGSWIGFLMDGDGQGEGVRSAEHESICFSKYGSWFGVWYWGVEGGLYNCQKKYGRGGVGKRSRKEVNRF
jgi:hypothetical protein